MDSKFSITCCLFIIYSSSSSSIVGISNSTTLSMASLSNAQRIVINNDLFDFAQCFLVLFLILVYCMH